MYLGVPLLLNFEVNVPEMANEVIAINDPASTSQFHGRTQWEDYHLTL